jgi:NADH-quinone oxidoreductase subunit J
MPESLIFYVLSGLAVGASALVIGQRNPMYSVLMLIVSFAALAGLYITLDAPFVAMAQMIIYAGAIMVLFLFVIMLLNLGHAESDLRGPSTIAATVVIVGLLAIELFALLQYTPRKLASEFSQFPTFTDPATVFVAGHITQQESAARGVVGAVAAPLFQVYLIPFEITSILLLVAIIGAVVLAKRKI